MTELKTAAPSGTVSRQPEHSQKHDLQIHAIAPLLGWNYNGNNEKMLLIYPAAIIRLIEENTVGRAAGTYMADHQGSL